MNLHPVPAIWSTIALRVGDLHTLHAVQAGNPSGEPVVVLHGGPGGATDIAVGAFFDPTFWRLILFDQRGAGKSTPSGECRENSTWDLVADMEVLREQLGVESWHLFGGSWGSTLALAYAVTHPTRVRSLTLRGIFLGRAHEVHWLYQHGASEVHPDAWQDFCAPIPEDERHEMVAAYHRRLFGSDEEIVVRCAQAWSLWEARISTLRPLPRAAERGADPARARRFARIENHYFVHHCFFPDDDWLLAQARRQLSAIPCTIVQGRYDMVCPVRSAWDLAAALPHAQLKITLAGHALSDGDNALALLQTTTMLQQQANLRDARAASPRPARG